MSLIYKKIAEVQVGNDYYYFDEVIEAGDIFDAIDNNASPGETAMETIAKIINDTLADAEIIEQLQTIKYAYRNQDDQIILFRLSPLYNILDDIDFIPTPNCLEEIKNRKIIFKKTPLGFILLAKAEQVSGNQYRTFVPFESELKLDFLVTVKNSFFFNFTNIPMSKKSNLFFFSNHGNASEDFYLTTPHAEVTSFSTEMKIGEILLNTNVLYELKEKITSAGSFDVAKVFQIGDEASRYVTNQDALLWEKGRYHYRNENNTHPGEKVTFVLTNLITGRVFNLGKITNTNRSQAEYITPIDASESLSHYIDLSNIPSGKYNMEITRQSGTENIQFYWFDPSIEPNTFGIIELYPKDIHTGFFEDNTTDDYIISPKIYQIRFKNRTTLWQYFDKKGRPIINDGDEDFRALKQQPSAYKLTLDGTETVVPDPDISIIYPQKDEDGVLEKIYSKTYLNLIN